MKKELNKFISVIFILLFPLLHVQPVFAHGDDARIEVSPERLNPGSVVDIRLVDFEPETEVGLMLLGREADVPLGTVTTDLEGIFLLSVALPADLAEGEYLVRGTTNDNHSVDSPRLTIWGSADLGSADGELRAEEDGLLAPMPTLGPDAPTPMMSSVAVAESVPPEESGTFPYQWIALGTGIALVTILILVLKKR
jgi:hypothetical protein